MNKKCCIGSPLAPFCSDSTQTRKKERPFHPSTITSKVQNPVLVKDLLFLSLHCVNHVCFVLNHLHRCTLGMCRHEREPS